MPRYKVVEVRALYSGILIEAVDEGAAQQGDGVILDEAETDTWGERLYSSEEVADDQDCVGDLP